MDNINFISLSDEFKETIKTNFDKKLDIFNVQLFNPIYVKYEKFDDPSDILKSKYFIKNINEASDNIDNDDNVSYVKTFVKAEVINQFNNTFHNYELFCKQVPIIDPIEELLQDKKDNYEFRLANIYNNNIVSKINNFQNAAYIDAFFTYIGSKMTETGKCPCFPVFFGTFSGVKRNYLFDLTEDFSDIKGNNNFQENLAKKYCELKFKKCEVDLVDIDDFEDDENLEILDNIEFDNIDLDDMITETIDIDSDEEKDSKIKGLIKIDDNFRFDDIISKNTDTIKYIQFPEMPVQIIFLEKLYCTLEEYVQKECMDVSPEEWKSILFQICFGLAVAQKRYNLVHNDLHCDNIMFQKTNIDYLYYNYEDQYFKIPTFGKIVKIIDFGRATFIHNKIIYFSDQFDQDGDAEGQYDYPENNSYRGCKVKPNFSFDLARLTSTIIHYFDFDSDIYKLLKSWITDKNNYFLMNDPDDFDLYKNIARNVKNAVPKKQIKKSIFKLFSIDKLKIPKKSFVYNY